MAIVNIATTHVSIMCGVCVCVCGKLFVGKITYGGQVVRLTVVEMVVIYSCILEGNIVIL